MADQTGVTGREEEDWFDRHQDVFDLYIREARRARSVVDTYREGSLLRAWAKGFILFLDVLKKEGKL